MKSYEKLSMARCKSIFIYLSSTSYRFDVILTAETIYDSTSYPHLHDIIDATLSSVGVAFIAAKQCYFGVGGDIYTFIEYVKQRGKFNIIDRWCSDSDIPRRILELTRIPSN